MSLLDGLLGDPDQLSVAGLERGIRRGSEGFAVRCVRALGERADAPTGPLVALLQREEAALRRAAARALANLGRVEALGPLAAAWPGERTEEGRIALAVARARCGEDPGSLAAALGAFDGRVIHTVGGARCPSSVHGLAPLAERLWAALGEGPGEMRPRVELLAARRRALTSPGSMALADRREPLQSLALLGAPEDFVTFQKRFRSVGRRGEHTLFLALGLTGDPRAATVLRDALRATDVDPGRGFAQRRLAATGLGRLGLRPAIGWLTRAVQDEAADFEGRPGAGLGIQYPVRTNLLWALGEIGAPACLPTLLAHLGDTHGSALGGFYLPAMDALYKLGGVAFPALRDAATHGTEVTAAHAVSVLAAGGEDVRRWASDPRPTVRQLAERVLAG